jgi:hypothetical protein
MKHPTSVHTILNHVDIKLLDLLPVAIGGMYSPDPHTSRILKRVTERPATARFEVRPIYMSVQSPLQLTKAQIQDHAERASVKPGFSDLG